MKLTTNKKLIAVLAAATVIVGGIGPARAEIAPSQNGQPTLYYSASNSRSAPVGLSRSTVKGNVYVTVDGAKSTIAAVTFRLDDPLAQRPVIRTERQYPFDFAGGAVNGSANAFDTSTVRDGRHSILAEVSLTNGRTIDVYARFTVANSGTTATTVVPTTSAPTITTVPTTTPPTTTAPTTTTVRPTATTTPPTSQGKNCLAKPSACGFPDATNTGWQHTGVVLKASGSLRVTQPGAIIDGLDIRGSVTILADNVTIKRSRLTSGDYYPIRHDNGNKNLLVEDTEIISTNGDVTSAISFTNYTARRVNVRGSADGLKADSNVTIEDSYIHDLSVTADSHNDGVQSTGGSNVTIRHNTIDLGPSGITSCLIFGGEWAAQTNITIVNNLLNGGAYTMYLDRNGSNRTISGNRFGRDHAYGIASIGGQYTWTNNIWDDTLAVANP